MADDILWESNIGSHIWGMNTPKSDLDLFQVYVRPTREILIGRAVKSKFLQDKEKNVDYAIHEIGEVVNQVSKGNINFVIGLTSPIINQATHWFYELYGTFVHNKSKNIFHSIRGMAISNYKKFIESNLDTSEKKKKTIMRIVEFGIRFLLDKEIDYRPPMRDVSVASCFDDAIQTLEGAYEISSLPTSPDTRIYDEFLARLRGSF